MEGGFSDSLAHGEVRLERLGEQHREAMRQACAEDTQIWAIYHQCLIEPHFDSSFEWRLAEMAAGRWHCYAALCDDELVGMSCYIHPDPGNGVVEIGGTYIVPAVRGSTCNRTMKHLMIDHAFQLGFRRVEFRIDTRNGRSMAAVRKLGAVHEGTLRKNSILWNGYERDTAVFSILRDEWRV